MATPARPLPEVRGVPEAVYDEPARTDNVALEALRSHVRRCVSCHLTGTACGDATVLIHFVVRPGTR